MRVLAVDDELLQLEKLEDAIYEAIPDARVCTTRRISDVLWMIREMTFDIAFLDIETRSNTNGIEIARKLKEVNPRINIIFVTAYDNFKSEALDLRASGYITKPVNSAKILAELQELRYPLKEAASVNPVSVNPVQDKQREDGTTSVSKKTVTTSIREEHQPVLYVQCFGNFDVFDKNHKPIHFSRSRGKEMLAYLVFRHGSRCSSQEIAAMLFEEQAYDAYVQDSFRHIASAMMKALKKVGAEKAVLKESQSYAINVNVVDCDYFRYLASDPTAKISYSGDFMSQYSWAEYVNAYLSSQV